MTRLLQDRLKVNDLLARFGVAEFFPGDPLDRFGIGHEGGGGLLQIPSQSRFPLHLFLEVVHFAVGPLVDIKLGPAAKVEEDRVKEAENDHHYGRQTGPNCGGDTIHIRKLPDYFANFLLSVNLLSLSKNNLKNQLGDDMSGE